MQSKNYCTSIKVDAPPETVTEKIAQVKLWWAKKVKGKSAEAGDTFRVDFGKTYVDFEVSESIPGKKVVWKVKDCNLHWIENNKEWNGTTVVFDLSKKDKQTQIEFTHMGLTPKAECYKDCKIGWDEHIGESLLQLINQGKGMPV
ncbi:MAG TPA: SRPBCC domain-containing protein [Chitinophagaceae bacterium]|jgi:activator of Hsp90 ATPase-like protein|nr:SRPBCC domain-containing protein [Chitinophagaceae bacterium]